MFLAFSLWDIIRVPFGWLIEQLYQLTANYGIALILFSLILRHGAELREGNEKS